MKKNNSYEQEIILTIRKVLLQDWDPIGVGDNPNLIDEYDGYIGQILELLLKKPLVEEIVDLLKDIENKYLGVSSNINKLHDVAFKLISLNI